MSDGNQIVQAAGEGELVVERQEDAAKTRALEGIVEGLPEKQQRALMLIAEGQPIREAAKTAGINRGTLYRWIKSDPHFRAAYNGWQMEQRESCRAGLLKVAETAVAKLVRSVDLDGHLAFKVVKELGLFGGATPLRLDPRQIEQEVEVESIESDNQLDSLHLKRAMEKIRLGRALDRVKRLASKNPPEIEENDAADDEEEDAKEMDRARLEGPPGEREEAVKPSPEAAPKPAANPALRQSRKERLSDVEARIG
jgi:hypothetical protein